MFVSASERGAERRGGGIQTHACSKVRSLFRIPIVHRGPTGSPFPADEPKQNRFNRTVKGSYSQHTFTILFFPLLLQTSLP